MITDIRLSGHQLAAPCFDNPEKLVQWMGAIQAQNYPMAKWAIGLRLKTADRSAIENALQTGKIIRTHILRPTWHFVAASDIRWMLKLSGSRIRSANDSFRKYLEIPEELFTRCNRLFEKILCGNTGLTKEEIGLALQTAGVETDTDRLTAFLIRAETEGIICSGADKADKPTYALLDERVAPAPDLHKEEALATLATRYFMSHSPASLQDFTWWSGLTATEAKQAVALIKNQLGVETYAGRQLYYHLSCNVLPVDKQLHLLPPYDEYLVSYKDRTDVLKPEHHRKAFNTFGIFYPVILHEGRIIGNWKTVKRKSKLAVETETFDCGLNIAPDDLTKATERYRLFAGTPGQTTASD